MSRICVKVNNLRKIGYTDLRNWLSDENNLYVGRKGRIFIDGKIFHYKGSIFGNPYKLSEYSITESLEKYEKYIRENLMTELKSLRGKNLGCFCDFDNRCHVDVLLILIDE